MPQQYPVRDAVTTYTATEAEGLVLCAITDQPGVTEPVLDLSGGFPSPDLVGVAAGLLTRVDLATTPGEWVERFQARNASRAVVEVRPGAVVLRGRRRVGVAAAGSSELAPHVRTGRDLRLGLSAEAPDVPEHFRGDVTAWSRRSRSRMTLTLASLDYGPLFELGTPAMVTYTLPGDWLTVAPTGKAFKRLMKEMFQRLERAYGKPAARLLWKLEFQGRGAPHLHTFMVPPTVLAHCSCPVCPPGSDLLPFRTWLSHTWADVVDHPDPSERAKHRAAGTGIDYREGLKARDPKRLAVYFSKHGGAAGGKEYQHDVPEAWQVVGAGPGRFWGVRGLSAVVESVPVTDQAFTVMKRTLRRLSQRQAFYGEVGSRWPTKVQRRTRSTRVPRGVQLSTGALTYRTVTRPLSYLNNSTGGGFLLVNDGPALASALARL
jgi:hypothetical protein